MLIICMILVVDSFIILYLSVFLGLGKRSPNFKCFQSMAHGWDSYYHNLSSDPETLRRTPQPEGSFSQHVQNFVGHNDFTNTVASHEPQTSSSDFDTNCYSNPSIGNSSSDCVYQRFYTETPWQAEAEQMGKDYLPRCGNSDMSAFATDGLSSSGTFPSPFTTDLQGIKQHCGMLTTSFLEDCSDISSCSDADAGETRPSCKFMAKNSVQKLKSDITPKNGLSEWLFSHTGTMMFPTETLPPNVAQTNVISASNVKPEENIIHCAQGEMKNPEQNVKSYTGQDQSSITSNMVTTTGSESVEDRKNNDACEDQKQKEDVEKDLEQVKHSVITISGYENLTDDGMEDYAYSNEDQQIHATASNVMSTFHKELDHFNEKILKKETEESLVQENEGFDNDCTHGPVRTMTEDEQDKIEVLKKEGKLFVSLESKTFDEQKSANSMDDEDKNMEIDYKEKEIKSSASQFSDPLDIKLSDFEDADHELTVLTSTLKNCHNIDSSLQFNKSVAQDSISSSSTLLCEQHLSDVSDKNKESVTSHMDSCIEPSSFSTNINSCQEKDWTSAGDSTNSTCNVSGVTSESISTNASEKNWQCVADHSEFALQTKEPSTDINACLEKELTDSAGRTNSTTPTNPENGDLALISDNNKQGVCSHVESHLHPERSNTNTNPCLENGVTSLLERKTTSSFIDSDCSGSGGSTEERKVSMSLDCSGCDVSSDCLFTSDKYKQNLANHPEFGLQAESSSTNINPCLDKHLTSREKRTINSSLDPDSSSGAAIVNIFTHTSDKNKPSVADHPQFDLQTDSSNTDLSPYLKNELANPTESTNQCSGPAVASESNEESVSSNVECCLQPTNSNWLEKEIINPSDRESNTVSIVNTNQDLLLDQSSIALKPQSLDVAEDARESFEELDTSEEAKSVLDMLYGEPLSREDSSCDTDERNCDTTEATLNRNSMENSKGQEPQLKSSREMMKLLQPVVILRVLESVNGMSGSYFCADCKHTTHNVDNLVEHHHCSHSVHNFQFCKTCNLYLMKNEQPEKHLCGITKESPQLSFNSSLQKTGRHGRHKCNRCGLIFSKVVLYIRHMRTHTGKTPFKCNKCGLYFAQAGTLQRHKRIPGRCKHVNLSANTSDAVKSKTKTSPQKDLMQNRPRPNLPDCYVRLVDISKTNLCSLCGKSFLTAEKTKTHVCNTHKKKSWAVSPNQFSTKPSGERTPKEENETRSKYKCPLCPRLFKYSYNRARHLRDCVRDSVYGGKEKVAGKYRCPLCHATFTLSSNRYRHIKAICLRECLSQLAKQRAKSVKKVEQKKTKETEPKTQAKENDQKKQKTFTGADPKIAPRYKCNLCPAAFCHASGKYKHMKKHELFKLTGKMFKYRNSVFSTRPGILTNTKNQKSNDSLKPVAANSSLPLNCHFCGKRFSTLQSLKKHERNHRGERPYRCLECGRGFKKHCHLIGHKIVHQRRIQCTVCRKILPTVGELIQHRNSHLKRGILQCPDCHLQFQYPAHLLRHLDAHKNEENKAPQSEEKTPLKPQQSLESVKVQSGLKKLQCSLCKEVFDDAQVLRKHCLTHISGSLSHQCPFCKHNFSNRRYLLRHMIKHTGDKPYSCENCGKQFYRDLYLKLHSERCFPVTHSVKSDRKTKRPYHCSYCPRSFCKKIRLKNHHYGHKVNSLLLCSQCGQYFGFRKLNQHQKNCGGTADTHNGNFSKSTSQINQNANKMPLQYNTTNVLKFKCPHCTQRFRYRSLFFRHLVSHTGLQPYVCMHCGHRFGTQTMCLQHEAFCDGVYKEGPSKVNSDASTKQQNREATQKPQAECETEYKCKFCTKTFMKSRNLRHHILTHNEVKPYHCKACESCFSRYDHLKVHQTRCKGQRTRLEVCIPKISLDDVGKGWQNRFGTEPAKKEETFECEVCPRSFPTQSKLSRHVTMFHVTKLFKCTRCGSSFAHEKSLKKHRKTNRCRSVSNNTNASLPQETKPPAENNLAKPLHVVKSRILHRITPCFNKKYKYVCSYCPRAFGNSWQLGVHTRLHTGERPFACDYCGQRFIRKDYVQRHYAKCTKKQQLNHVLCEKCGGFFSDVELENHKRNCTSKPSPSQSKSAACQRQQSTSQSLPKGFSCAYCSSRFLLFSQLQEHFLNAHKLETMAPPVSTAPLQHHLSNIPNIKEEPLDESCDERRDEGANLTYNLNTAFESEVTNQFFCPDCKISFARKSGLTAHLRGHAMKYPFNCKTCKKGFWNKTLLRNHHRKCRFDHTSEMNANKMLEVPLKAEINFALDNAVLMFKEGSETTGTGLLQTNFSCKDDLKNESPQNPEEALVQCSSSKENKAVQYQCSECDKSFTDGLLLISHLEDHGRQEQEKKRKTCFKCGQVCISQAHLENHMKVHGIDKKYPCPDCSKMVYNSSDLEIHRTCHDPNRPFVCKLCNQRFWTRPSLCNHYNEDHPDDVFSCRFCNKAYSVKKSLTRHYKKWHEKEQKDLGNSVQEKSSTEQQSTSQVSTTCESDEDENNGSEDSDSDSPYFPCHVCGKTFPTSESLEDHQRCHLGEKPHECEECGKCFFQASQLQQHQRMHKSEFQCQACGRGFVSLFALRKHKHTHGKSRPYRCSKCQLSFTGHSQLAEHMFTHREENFPCDICNRVFLSKSSRAEHRKSHSKSGDQHPPSVLRGEYEKSGSLSKSSSVFTKELKYRCGVCGERFRDPEELSEHGCMAAKERLYCCSDCDKHFLHASHLKKHRTTHHLSCSTSEYPCNKCNNSFSSSQHFLNHLKTHVDSAGELELNMENKDKGPSHGFICPVCHQCFPSATALSCHFSTHPEGTFECKVCKITFPTKSKLDKHEQCHLTSSTEFECTECGESFLGSDAFRQHNCSHQEHARMENKNTNPSAKASLSTYQAGEEEDVDVLGEDFYYCLLCSMQFSSKSSFLEHQNKQHLNEKPFKCELCGKTFAMRRYLKEHERRHRTKLTAQNSQSPEKNYRCTQCHTRFSTAQGLSVHMRLHAEKEVGQFRCDMCYKSFSQWQLLKLHQESHVGEVVYECTECDKAFAFPHLLEEHQQTHAGSSH